MWVHMGRAWCYAALAPKKDMEIVIQADGMRNAAFHALLFNALRALINQLGVECFNVGILNIRVGHATNGMDDGLDPPPIVARCAIH
jgi:hypothetical protein